MVEGDKGKHWGAAGEGGFKQQSIGGGGGGEQQFICGGGVSSSLCARGRP